MGPGHTLGGGLSSGLCSLILLLTLEISPKRWRLPLSSDSAPTPNTALLCRTVASLGVRLGGGVGERKAGWVARVRKAPPTFLFQSWVALRPPQLPALW